MRTLSVQLATGLRLHEAGTHSDTCFAAELPTYTEAGSTGRTVLADKSLLVPAQTGRQGTATAWRALC